jgi:hypothetical protein
MKMAVRKYDDRPLVSLKHFAFVKTFENNNKNTLVVFDSTNVIVFLLILLHQPLNRVTMMMCIEKSSSIFRSVSGTQKSKKAKHRQ